MDRRRALRSLYLAIYEKTCELKIIRALVVSLVTYESRAWERELLTTSRGLTPFQVPDRSWAIELVGAYVHGNQIDSNFVSNRRYLQIVNAFSHLFNNIHDSAAD